MNFQSQSEVVCEALVVLVLKLYLRGQNFLNKEGNPHKQLELLNTSRLRKGEGAI